MKKEFLPGILGALMDEYERVLFEFTEFVSAISATDFSRIVDSETTDEDCHSVQTIVSHVINSGYSYADYIRAVFAIPTEQPPRKIINRQDVPQRIGAMLRYTQATLEGKWSLSEDQIFSIVIQARWGGDYNLEQLLEHAIVHVLRHRRQINKFIHLGDLKLSV